MVLCCSPWGKAQISGSNPAAARLSITASPYRMRTVSSVMTAALQGFTTLAISSPALAISPGPISTS